MSYSIIFRGDVRLFGVNIGSTGPLQKFKIFPGLTPIKVNNLNYCNNLGFEFLVDGYKFEMVSKELMEVIK